MGDRINYLLIVRDIIPNILKYIESLDLIQLRFISTIMKEYIDDEIHFRSKFRNFVLTYPQWMIREFYISPLNINKSFDIYCNGHKLGKRVLATCFASLYPLTMIIGSEDRLNGYVKIFKEMNMYKSQSPVESDVLIYKVSTHKSYILKILSDGPKNRNQLSVKNSNQLSGIILLNINDKIFTKIHHHIEKLSCKYLIIWDVTNENLCKNPPSYSISRTKNNRFMNMRYRYETLTYCIPSRHAFVLQPTPIWNIWINWNEDVNGLLNSLTYILYKHTKTVIIDIKSLCDFGLSCNRAALFECIKEKFINHKVTKSYVEFAKIKKKKKCLITDERVLEKCSAEAVVIPVFNRWKYEEAMNIINHVDMEHDIYTLYVICIPTEYVIWEYLRIHSYRKWQEYCGVNWIRKDLSHSTCKIAKDAYELYCDPADLCVACCNKDYFSTTDRTNKCVNWWLKNRGVDSSLTEDSVRLMLK